MNAATSVGYPARPPPLFYAISQAGRAIAAVHADDPWELSGHGLKYELRRPLFESIVKPAPGNSDSFSSVCTALSQDALGRPVELGALWCSLPDFWGIDLPGERWPRALRVVPPTIDFAANLLSTTSVPAVICGLPNHLFDGLSDEDSTNALRNELAHYPGAGDWEPSVTVPHPDEYRRHVNVQWRSESPRMRPHVPVPRPRTALATADAQPVARHSEPPDDLVGAPLRPLDARSLSPGSMDTRPRDRPVPRCDAVGAGAG